MYYLQIKSLATGEFQTLDSSKNRKGLKSLAERLEEKGRQVRIIKKDLSSSGNCER